MTIDNIKDNGVDDESGDGPGVAIADHHDRDNADDITTNTCRYRLRRAMSRWPLIVVGLLLAASAAGAGGLYFGLYRVDQQTDRAAAAKSVIGAASDGSVALLSYAPDKLDGDLAAAKSHLTGDFLTYYTKFTDQIMAPAAKERAVNTTASVKRAAIVELHPGSARVLVFLNQTTTSKDAPDPVQTTSSVMVSLTKSDGAWLISAFDPI